MNPRFFYAVLITIVTGGAAFGHEGHGAPGQGHTVQHYLLEPAHLPVVMVAVALVTATAFALGRFWKRRSEGHQVAGVPQQRSVE